MSDIKRFDEVPNEFGDYEIEEDANGEYMLYGVHAAVVKELEGHLAEARKDQARYCETVKLYISGDLPLQLDTAENKKEFDLSIDAAIKEQGK